MGEALNVFLRHSEGLGSASFFAFLLTLLVLLGLWSGLGHFSDIFKGPSARQLFLTVPMRLSALPSKGKGRPGKTPAKADFSGHVIALNAQKASFISPVALTKGTKVTIELTSLPDFPATPTPFEVEVVRVSPLKGKADNFMVEANFGQLADEQKAPLLNYLQRLTGASRLAAG